MSEQTRIEIVRRAMAAVARRDVSGFVADLAEDCELRPLMSVWPQPYRGHDGIARWFVDLGAVWDEFSVEPEGFRGAFATTRPSPRTCSPTRLGRWKPTRPAADPWTSRDRECER